MRCEGLFLNLHFIVTAEGGALRSISEMGAMLTMLTTNMKPGAGPSSHGPQAANGSGGVDIEDANSSAAVAGSLVISSKDDNLVMDTKLNIIEILRFILDVRLDYRISCLLSIFKREFDESDKNERFGTTTKSKNLIFKNDYCFRLQTRGVHGIDLEGIGAKAEAIFGNCSDSEVLDLDENGGKTFLRVLLHLAMHDYPPLVSGALKLLFRNFSQRQEVLQAFKQVQLLVSDRDVEHYKQIKDDLDGLRLLVEKSELWVYKAKTVEEKPSKSGAVTPNNAGSQEQAKRQHLNGGMRSDTKDEEDEAFNNNIHIKNRNLEDTTPPVIEVAAPSPNDSKDSSGMGEKMSLAVAVAAAKQKACGLDYGLKGFSVDLEYGPPSDHIENYKTIQQILTRMNKLCIQEGKPRKHEQRLLRNMGVHTVVLDLLKIPYDHKEDVRMNILMRLAHEFLQNFCLGNQQNQALLHKHLDLFLTPGLLEAETMCAIFQDNASLCTDVSEKVIQHFVHCIESHGRHVQYLKFLQTVVKNEAQSIRRCQDMVMHELLTAGEDALVFYNDKASFNYLIEIQRNVGNLKPSTHIDEADPDESSNLLRYHIELVKLLACCTMGKNVITEIKCHSLLPLDDIVKMVCHKDTIPEVKDAYVNFLTHCYIDTEAEVKEIYCSNHMWQLFEHSFIQDMSTVSTSAPRTKLALKSYVTGTLAHIITTFFNSQYSDQSTKIQVRKSYNAIYYDKA